LQRNPVKSNADFTKALNKVVANTGIPRTTVETILSKFAKKDENGKITDSVIFRDFEQEGSALRIYEKKKV
jgi:hypothetical protein